jgi:ribulose 1,5-bisphosphate synthetase/thiazole synthase
MRGASKRSSLRAQEHLESRPIFSASAHDGDGANSHGEEGQVLDTLVVGGGISGCTAAFYLQQRGVNCLLAEARDELGGNIITRSGI